MTGPQLSELALLVAAAVDHGLLGADYTPGTKTPCPDWNAHNGCGNGLHFSPRAFMTKRYASDATRFVACKVKVADLVVIGDYQPDKCKAPACTVMFECDEDGERVDASLVKHSQLEAR